MNNVEINGLDIRKAVEMDNSVGIDCGTQAQPEWRRGRGEKLGQL